jgi:hypothetical protein
MQLCWRNALALAVVLALPAASCVRTAAQAQDFKRAVAA